jgi:hypothetical protein
MNQEQIKKDAVEITMSFAAAVQQAGGKVDETWLDMPLRDVLATLATNGVRFAYREKTVELSIEN